MGRARKAAIVATLSAAPETIEAVEKDRRLPRLSSEGSSLENHLLRRIMATVAVLRRAKLTGYVALLRAVNVGGTGKLPMKTLTQICETARFGKAKTYIASGNVVFQSDGSENAVRTTLEDRLHQYAGKRVGVIVRTAAEMADTLDRNPFVDSPGNRVMALFVDGVLPADPLDGVTGIKTEQVRLGKRELFILYPDGMANTRLRIPSEKQGTARNMNTVAKLAEMAAAIA